MEDNSGQLDGIEIKADSQKEKQKSLICIAAVLAALVALTFAFKYAALLIINTPLRIAVIIVIYIAMAMIVFVACRIEKRRVSDLGFTKDKLLYQILIGLGIAVGLAFLIGALPILIGGGEMSLIGGKPTGAFNIALSIVTCLTFVGFNEEIIFRGYVQTRINELTKHKFVGVLIAAALFGLWHIINGGWIQVAFTFVIGSIFGFCRAYLKNCSLLSVIIAHGVYDSLLVVIALILL